MTEQNTTSETPTELSGLVMRIDSIANTHCSNYARIDKADAMEKLYAIESTLVGVGMANQDLHRVIEKFRQKCGMSVDEVLSMFDDA